MHTESCGGRADGMRPDGQSPDGIYNAYLNGIDSGYPTCCIINYCQLWGKGIAPGEAMTKWAESKYGRSFRVYLSQEYVLCPECIEKVAKNVTEFARGQTKV